MKIIEPSVKLIENSYGLLGGFEMIARAGRICYASDQMGHEVEFVDRLLAAKHYRPLEFFTVYLIFPRMEETPWKKYRENNWSRVVEFPDNENVYVTTNYRVIKENHWDSDIAYLSDEPTKWHKFRYTFLWTIARSTADEFRTHVALSSLMQSTRYCCYSKSKFGNQLTFIKPSDNGENKRVDRLTRLFWKASEIGYKWLIQAHARAEQARRILPLDIKTEFIQCGYEEDWDNFFNQRYFGTTGKPHPDAKYIAKQAYEQYQTAKQRWEQCCARVSERIKGDF